MSLHRPQDFTFIPIVLEHLRVEMIFIFASAFTFVVSLHCDEHKVKIASEIVNILHMLH